MKVSPYLQQPLRSLDQVEAQRRRVALSLDARASAAADRAGAAERAEKPKSTATTTPARAR